MYNGHYVHGASLNHCIRINIMLQQMMSAVAVQQDKLENKINITDVHSYNKP